MSQSTPIGSLNKNTSNENSQLVQDILKEINNENNEVDNKKQINNLQISNNRSNSLQIPRQIHMPQQEQIQRELRLPQQNELPPQIQQQIKQEQIQQLKQQQIQQLKQQQIQQMISHNQNLQQIGNNSNQVLPDLSQNINLQLPGSGSYLNKNMNLPNINLQQLNNNNNNNNLIKNIINKIKNPLIVSSIAFFLSIPFIDKFIINYIPKLATETSTLNIFGIILKALLAGIIYFISIRFLK